MTCWCHLTVTELTNSCFMLGGSRRIYARCQIPVLFNAIHSRWWTFHLSPHWRQAPGRSRHVSEPSLDLYSFTSPACLECHMATFLDFANSFLGSTPPKSVSCLNISTPSTSSTEIWSLRTFWLMMRDIWNWQTLVSQNIARHARIHFVEHQSILHQKCYSIRATASQSTGGRWAS